MTWLPQRAPGATPLDQVFGLIPEAYARFREFYGALWSDGGLDPAVLELARLRVAQIVGAAGEGRIRFSTDGRGPSAEQVAALPQWPDAPVFSAIERAVIGFAEQYALDPHELRDRDFDELRTLFSSEQIAALVLCVAMFDALARFRTALGADPTGDDTLAAPVPTAATSSLP